MLERLSSWSASENTAEVLAAACRVEGADLVVTLRDGRELRTPVENYPLLRHATRAQLANVQLVGSGLGLHWPDLDEDLSVAGLLRDAASVGPARFPIAKRR